MENANNIILVKNILLKIHNWNDKMSKKKKNQIPWQGPKIAFLSSTSLAHMYA